MKARKIEKIFDLSGKTAIVTGGSGMLGLVYTSVLLEAGANVAIFDKKDTDKQTLNKLLKKRYGHNTEQLNRFEIFTCDISSPKEVNKAFNSFRRKFKSLDILINNASLVKQVGRDSLEDIYKPFLKMKPDDWEQYFKVDLSGAMLMVQKAVPLMKKSGEGVIVNISSTYGILSPDQRLYKSLSGQLSGSGKAGGFSVEKPIGYSVSKAGVLNLTRHLATLLGKYNIRVNTLTPGGVFADNPDEFIRAYSDKTPLGRMADKEELRGPLLFLVSAASSYMTGSNLIVDGGWSAW